MCTSSHEILDLIIDATTCPFCFDYMQDSVVIADGYTYHQHCIMDYFSKSHNLVSLKTNERLKHKRMSPNYLINRLATCLVHNTIPDPNTDIPIFIDYNTDCPKCHCITQMHNVIIENLKCYICDYLVLHPTVTHYGHLIHTHCYDSTLQSQLQFQPQLQTNNIIQNMITSTIFHTTIMSTFKCHVCSNITLIPVTRSPIHKPQEPIYHRFCCELHTKIKTLYYSNTLIAFAKYLRTNTTILHKLVQPLTNLQLESYDIINTIFEPRTNPSKLSKIYLLIEHSVKENLIITLLTDDFSDFNAIDPYGFSLLTYAAFHNLKYVCQRLLNYNNININHQDHMYGMTALMRACHEGHTHVAITLINHPDINLECTDYNNKTALIWACELKLTKVVNSLLQKHISIKSLNTQDNEGYTALLITCRNNSPHLATKLLQLGVNLKLHSHSGLTAYRWAKFYDWTLPQFV